MDVNDGNLMCNTAKHKRVVDHLEKAADWMQIDGLERFARYHALMNVGEQPTTADEGDPMPNVRDVIEQPKKRAKTEDSTRVVDMTNAVGTMNSRQLLGGYLPGERPRERDDADGAVLDLRDPAAVAAAGGLR